MSFLEVLDRAHTGPVCEVRDWDSKVIPTNVKKKLKEYGLEGTFDRENPVNMDDSLADDFWKAGLEMAVETGALCTETRRVIKFTEEELKEIINEAPSEIVLGSGKDRIMYRARRPEDKIPPITCFGPMGIELSEDLFIPIMQSVMQHRIIDIPVGGVPDAMHGREIKAGTPYETLVAKYEVALMKEAMRRAGRPWMPISGFMTSATEYGQLGGFGLEDYFRVDFGLVFMISELKTSYKLLHKTAHDVINHEGLDAGEHWSMIGGYVGPAEGAALTSVAARILQSAIHLVFQAGIDVLDIRYLGNCGRDAVWANSVCKQAVSRNSSMLIQGLTSQTHGPCTPGLLYETSVIAVSDVASGVSQEAGTRPTGCKYKNYCSCMENKFAAEVTKSAAGVKRDLANEIARTLIPMYEQWLHNPPKGKSFTECTDIKTMKPTKEWLDIYNKVKERLIDLGFPYKY